MIDEEVDVSEVVSSCNCSDYSSQFNELITLQKKQIENQEAIITTLSEQQEILLEQVNGMITVTNYLNAFFVISVSSIAVLLLWHILNKWFFRGV